MAKSIKSLDAEQRIEQLEREVRWFKRSFSLLAVVVGVVVVSGAWVNNQVPDVLSAKTFLLVDGSGRHRAKLHTDPQGGAHLLFLNPAGRPALNVTSGRQFNGVFCMDDAGRDRTVINYNHTRRESNLYFRAENGIQHFK